MIRPTSTRETWRTSPIAAPKVKSREAASIHWPQESERKLRKGRLLQKKRRCGVTQTVRVREKPKLQNDHFKGVFSRHQFS